MVDYQTQSKREAQLFNIVMWDQFTGRDYLLSWEQYWTLIDTNSFEIETLEDAQFLRSRQQFVGVNIDAQVCCDYATKYGIKTIPLEWRQALRKQRSCLNGGVVYLDTMVELDGRRNKIASALLNETMEACGPGTLICANFCFSNRYRHNRTVNADRFLEHVEFGEGWEHIKLPHGGDYSLPPKTNQTQMVTFFFGKTGIKSNRKEAQ